MGASNSTLRSTDSHNNVRGPQNARPSSLPTHVRIRADLATDQVTPDQFSFPRHSRPASVPLNDTAFRYSAQDLLTPSARRLVIRVSVVSPGHPTDYQEGHPQHEGEDDGAPVITSSTSRRRSSNPLGRLFRSMKKPFKHSKTKQNADGLSSIDVPAGSLDERSHVEPHGGQLHLRLRLPGIYEGPGHSPTINSDSRGEDDHNEEVAEEEAWQHRPDLQTDGSAFCCHDYAAPEHSPYLSPMFAPSSQRSSESFGLSYTRSPAQGQSHLEPLEPTPPEQPQHVANNNEEQVEEEEDNYGEELRQTIIESYLCTSVLDTAMDNRILASYEDINFSASNEAVTRRPSLLHDRVESWETTVSDDLLHHVEARRSGAGGGGHPSTSSFPLPPPSPQPSTLAPPSGLNSKAQSRKLRRSLRRFLLRCQARGAMLPTRRVPINVPLPVAWKYFPRRHFRASLRSVDLFPCYPSHSLQEDWCHSMTTLVDSTCRTPKVRKQRHSEKYGDDAVTNELSRLQPASPTSHEIAAQPLLELPGLHGQEQKGIGVAKDGQGSRAGRGVEEEEEDDVDEEELMFLIPWNGRSGETEATESAAAVASSAGIRSSGL